MVDPRAVVAAAIVGKVPRIVLRSDDVVLDFGRRERLFTGQLREAVLLSARRWVWRGCDRPASQSQADHVHPHGRHGPTNVANGAPLCEHHNIWKNQGFRTWRDSHALWHTYRPDGTEIVWPTYRLHLSQIGAD